MVRIKRIYDAPDDGDGFRVLVDRLWPRGMSKKKAKLDLWLKDIAPSDGLRKWFGHNPEKWDGFRNRYFKELDAMKNRDELAGRITERARTGRITLLYAAQNEKNNNAAALKEYLEQS